VKFLSRLVIVFVLAIVSLSATSLALDKTTYRTRDGRSWIRVVSSDELEYRHDGTTFLCKYSVQDGSLRVILTVLGTQQVLYFNRTPDGYKSEDGEYYMTPAAIADLQRREQAAREAQQLAQQAEAARRAEAERVAREAAQQREEREKETAAKQLKADIDMLEGTDCSTEPLSVSVPRFGVRDFVLSPDRACWTPWLIGKPYPSWNLDGDVDVQVVFPDGTTKEAVDGPGKEFPGIYKEPLIRSWYFPR
jgi:hypothetical protein